MANPNIVSTSNIVGVTATLNVSTTSTSIVTNPVSSSHVYKINGLFLSSYSTSNIGVSVFLSNSGRSLVNTYIIANTSVPSNTTFVAIDKNAPFYMQENDSLYIQAGVNNSIHALITYEDIS